MHPYFSNLFDLHNFKAWGTAIKQGYYMNAMRYLYIYSGQQFIIHSKIRSNLSIKPIFKIILHSGPERRRNQAIWASWVNITITYLCLNIEETKSKTIVNVFYKKIGEEEDG